MFSIDKLYFTGDEVFLQILVTIKRRAKFLDVEGSGNSLQPKKTHSNSAPEHYKLNIINQEMFK